MATKDHVIGSLLGLAIGDAMGQPVEFRKRDSFPEVTGFRSGGPFNLLAGQWTDDTSMALCLATSLVETREMDLRDQMTRYIRWWQTGYLSSTGEAFDIGNQTVAALVRFIETAKIDRVDRGGLNDGNGSLMRLAPVPMVWHNSPELAGQMAAESSVTTHPTVRCQEVCSAYAQLMVSAMNGASKAEIFDLCHELSRTVRDSEVQRILRQAGAARRRDEISSSGYVISSCEAALWAFASTEDFASGLLLAVNLGDDADTVAAIYGQLAGAFYGLSGIPERWVDQLWDSPMLLDIAEQLYELGKTLHEKQVQSGD